MRGLETQTEPLADRDPGDARAEAQRLARDRRRSSRSIRERVPSRALVTQTERSPVGDPQRAVADRDRLGDRDVVAAEEQDEERRAIAGDDAADGSPRPPAGRRPAAPAASSRRRAGRSPSTAVGRPGVSERTRVAAGVAPWRSRAASIRAPAVG